MCICISAAAHYTRLQLGGLGWLVDCLQLCTNFGLGHLASYLCVTKRDRLKGFDFIVVIAYTIGM